MILTGKLETQAFAAMETPAGIAFEEGTGTSSTTTESTGTELTTPDKPVTKPAGRLPAMGELATPLLYIVAGIMLVLLGMVFFLGGKRDEQKREDQ